MLEIPEIATCYFRISGISGISSIASPSKSFGLTAQRRAGLIGHEMRKHHPTGIG
jgi:hypothetical protein